MKPRTKDGRDMSTNQKKPTYSLAKEIEDFADRGGSARGRFGGRLLID